MVPLDDLPERPRLRCRKGRSEKREDRDECRSTHDDYQSLQGVSQGLPSQGRGAHLFEDLLVDRRWIDLVATIAIGVGVVGAVIETY